jgi:hypothetical protein
MQSVRKPEDGNLCMSAAEAYCWEASPVSEWGNFFIAQVGASAALAGLIFVGVSINLERILKKVCNTARPGT